MSALFKGHWLHWCGLLACFLILATAGLGALHVREFSWFALLVLSTSLGMVLLVGAPRFRDPDPRPASERGQDTSRNT